MAHRIRPAKAQEAEAISDLAFRSKAHWGYDAAFMDNCRAELTLTPAQIEADRVLVAEEGDRLLAVGCLSATEGQKGEIYSCFVEPAEIGRGLGRSLLEALMAEARQQGLSEIHVDSDPHARAFYEALGFVYVGDVPSGSIAGRFLPHLVAKL